MAKNSFATLVLRPADATVFDRMLDTLIALLPAAIAGCVFFGYRAVLLLLLCALTAVVAEWLVCFLLHTECCIKDLTSVVTGLLVGMTLPAAMPIPAAMLISATAVVVARTLFGGYGCEIVSPPAFGAVLALVSYPKFMTSYTDAFTHVPVEGVPLTEDGGFTLKQLLFGAHGGAIGEVGSIFLAVGALYLFVRRVHTVTVPVMTVTSVALFSLLFGMDVPTALLGGGLLLGAVFMAPERSVAPESVTGQLVYALVCGLLTVLIRRFADAAEGIYFAILAVNILRPLFSAIPDILTREASSDE